MGKKHVALPVPPRVMSAGQTAAYIGVSETKFADMRKAGQFPVKALSYGAYYDRNAVDHWLNEASGLNDNQPATEFPTEYELIQGAEAAWLKAAQNG